MQVPLSDAHPDKVRSGFLGSTMSRTPSTILVTVARPATLCFDLHPHMARAGYFIFRRTHET
nr:MAG TPA: hypothetical protein [Caudoviricetes sp.]